MSLFQVFCLESIGNIHGANAKAKQNKINKKELVFL